MEIRNPSLGLLQGVNETKVISPQISSKFCTDGCQLMGLSASSEESAPGMVSPAGCSTSSWLLGSGEPAWHGLWGCSSSDSCWNQL